VSAVFTAKGHLILSNRLYDTQREGGHGICAIVLSSIYLSLSK
jgi:hypothetical protein